MSTLCKVLWPNSKLVKDIYNLYNSENDQKYPNKAVSNSNRAVTKVWYSNNKNFAIKML